MKEIEIGGKCSAHVVMRNSYTVSFVNPEVMRPLGELLRR